MKEGGVNAVNAVVMVMSECFIGGSRSKTPH